MVELNTKGKKVERKKFSISFALVLNKKRPSDRFLLSEIHQKEGEEEKGSVFFLIELLNPWFPAASISQSIIETTLKTYYEGISSEPQCFEEALRATNDMLARRTQEGQTEWLGNLNAIIGLIFENQLHFAKVGRVSCYLFREGVLSKITEDEEETHPLKTFSNIISGNLEIDDKLIIGNEEFFDNLSLDYLKHVSIHSPSQAATFVAHSLFKEKAKNASAILASFEKKESPIAKPPFIIYLDELRKPFFPIIKEKTLPILSQVYALLSFLFSKIKPYFIWFVVKLGKATLFLLSFLLKFLKKIFSLPYLRHMGRKSKEILKFRKGFLEKLGLKKSYHKLKTFFSSKKVKRWVFLSFLVILFFLLIFFSISFISKKREKINALKNQEILKEVQNNLYEADLALLKEDKEKAKELYQKSFSLITAIKEKNEETEETLSKIEKSLDELNKIQKITKPKEILDFSSIYKEALVSRLFIFDKSPLSVDLNTNVVYKDNKKTLSFPQVSGKFKDGALQESEKILIVYQDPGGIYEYNLSENKIDKASPSFEEEWKKADLITSYLMNLYLLNKKEGQIYRYTKTTSGYSKSTEIVDPKAVDLKKAISFTIDGYIYVLNEDKKVLKLLSGKPQKDFALKGIPEPKVKIKRPSRIFTSEDTLYLYILDKEEKAVLEFDKFGNYQRQFIFPDFVDLKDLFVSPKNKKLYILNGTKVYETKI